MVRTFIATCVMAALIGLTEGFIENTNASTFDRTTYFTFSQPVAIPGVTLPAGTYLFRLADPNSGRRIINVQNMDGTRSYAMFHTIPAWRVDAPVEPEVSFMETASGMPAAIKTIWYQGEHNGLEFVYPREQFLRLTRDVPAGASPSPRATEPADGASRPAVLGEPASRAEAEGPEYTVADGVADESYAASAASSSVPATSAPVSSPSQDAREALPNTASLIPIALLVGVGTVLGGLGLRKRG
ncbi:MAG: hypothetical protein ACRD3C_15705 [Vicinamibacterales bacterium]